MEKLVTIPALRTRKLKNRNSIVVSHGLFTIVATLDILLDGKSSLGERVGLFFFVFILAMLGVARYLNAININNRPKLHILFYCLAICTGIIFFGRIGTIFTYSWLLVLFLTYTYYGIKAAFGSLLLLASTLEGQLLFKAYQTSEGINKENISIALMQLGIISAMALFFFDTEKAAEDDHARIIDSMEQTQLEHQRILSLMNNMTDAVIATDEQGFITLYNASALSILDTNQSLTGKKIGSVLEIVDKRRHKTDVLKLCIANKGYIDSREYRLRYSNKEVINLHLIVSQIKSGFNSQDLKGYMMTFHDITKEKSLEEERDEFISVISHELRTPVAVMEANISNAQFMIEKNQTIDTIKTSLDNAHSQAIYLAGMLNDLATLGKAENSQLSADPKPIHPVEILETLYNNYSRPARDKGLRIYKKISDNTPSTISSNGLYVQEILQNFMSNAIKYTKSGRISISVEGSEGGVKFSVKDTGIGIGKSDLTKIFNKFFRSEDYRTRETSGNGLGLYIAKKLAKIIEAEFEIQTVLNSGSTFTLFVPDMKSKRPK